MKKNITIDEFIKKKVEENPGLINDDFYSYYLNRKKDFIGIPSNFLSAEARKMFDPNAKWDFTQKKKDKFLQHNKIWREERIGDYLGPKIPSLMEFLENKIRMREVLGTTLVSQNKGPKQLIHKMPKHLRQEENLLTLMKKKNDCHPEVIFESEFDTLDPSRPASYPRKPH